MAKKVVDRSKLSERHHQIMELIMQGYADKEIAQQLGLSYHTVKGHISHLYDRLGAVDRAHAVAIYLGKAEPRRR